MLEQIGPKASILTKRCVAGSVILYNSEERVVQNIATYIDQIDHLFVVDNSDTPNPQLIKAIQTLPNITYVACNGNKGVAYALNRAAEAAVQGGYRFLLTMDDDSQVPAKMLDTMLEFITNHPADQIGIVGSQSIPERVSESVSSVWFTITSGSFLNLEAYVACGPFMDSLFIDWVDHEYCFRLIRNGFKIFEINYLALGHRLGHEKQAHLFGHLIRRWPSHSAVRMYYKVRNSLFVLRQYRQTLPVSITRFFYRAMLTDLITILLFEDSKIIRLRLVSRAIKDYLKGNLGKLDL
jgi:rhamnosyltransferase